jgi:hypothetical protein
VLLGRTFDIGRGGCFVDALHPWSGGTPIRIGIANGKERFEVAARIVHAEMDGMGIAFDQPVPQSQLNLLDRWLTPSKK